MPEEIDIYRVANLLINQHGDAAAIFAAMQADASLEKGDLDRKAAWLAVIRAIEELQDTTPARWAHGYPLINPVNLMSAFDPKRTLAVG